MTSNGDGRTTSGCRPSATRRRAASCTGSSRCCGPAGEILAFDPAGSGRIAEVFGDLDRADRISLVVPGVDTDLLTFQRSDRRYTAPVGMAKSLYRAERAADSGTRTAVIAWADYTAPAGLGVEAATAMRAADGAVRLNALLRALPGRAPVALYCHSYGSVVCGVAAHRLPARVSDIAVAGSPGMRTGTAAGLGTSARVWAMRDADDWIQDVPYLEVGGLGHGADPVSRGFGARVLSARDAKGHTGYFVPGTDSLRNFMRHRRGGVRHGGVRPGQRRVPGGSVRHDDGRTRVETQELRSARGGDGGTHAAYDEPHG